mmetsp:Transcript_43624/g.136483  ORF Transcript_43624/g.136483 Transcript_43624/m.136483 type:complete len:343 (+) Transcript_43624:269-1297(+)
MRRSMKGRTDASSSGRSLASCSARMADCSSSTPPARFLEVRLSCRARCARACAMALRGALPPPVACCPSVARSLSERACSTTCSAPILATAEAFGSPGSDHALHWCWRGCRCFGCCGVGGGRPVSSSLGNDTGRLRTTLVLEELPPAASRSTRRGGSGLSPCGLRARLGAACRRTGAGRRPISSEPAATGGPAGSGRPAAAACPAASGRPTSVHRRRWYGRLESGPSGRVLLGCDRARPASTKVRCGPPARVPPHSAKSSAAAERRLPARRAGVPCQLPCGNCCQVGEEPAALPALLSCVLSCCSPRGCSSRRQRGQTGSCSLVWQRSQSGCAQGVKTPVGT